MAGFELNIKKFEIFELMMFKISSKVYENLDPFFDKAQLILSNVFKIALVIAACLDVFYGRWMLLFLNLLALFLMFLPAIFEHNYKITLPTEFEFLIVFFIFGSLFLGETFNYYNRFWWWDIFLHGISSIILGYIGFLILYVLYSEKLIKANPFLLVLFSFSFAVALGALWEIFEYFMDQSFGLNMQKSGLKDTMEDLIIDSLGALFSSTLGFIYLKFHRGWIIKDWVLNFIKENPRLFLNKKDLIKIKNINLGAEVAKH